MRPTLWPSSTIPMVAAPSRWGLARPALEGTGEGAELGVVQDLGDLAERQVRPGEQHAGDLEANLVDDLPIGMAFGLQVPVQGSARDREEAGDRVGREALPEEFDPKHAPHLLGERSRAMTSWGERRFHRLSLAQPGRHA